VFVGGWAENASSEVVLTGSVDLHFENEFGTPLGMITVEAGDTAGFERLSQLVALIQAELTTEFAGLINVTQENDRVVFFSDSPFTITAESINVNLLGMPGGDNAANEAIQDAEYIAPDVPAVLGVTEEVTLIVNRGNGTEWGSLTFDVDPGLTLQELADLLNDELDDSILNDFWVTTSTDKLKFTNAYDFEFDESSVNVDILGMTDVDGAVSPVASTRPTSQYEARGINSLFGEVLVTGGYIAAKHEITLQNINTTEHSYTGPDIGVRIQGSSEITTHDDYSLIEINALRDAEVEGHIIAGGEVVNIRDAESGGYIGSELIDFGVDTAHTEIHITAEHQVRIGTVVRAGGLIQITGGDDPYVATTPDDIFNFTGASVLVYGSAMLETWGENSQVVLEGPNEIKVFTPTHFDEIEPDVWVKGNVARIVAEGQFMLSGYLPAPVTFHMWKRVGTTEYEEYVTIPAIDMANDPGLLWFMQTTFAGSTHFGTDDDFEVEQEGRYLMFTGYGYDFAILADGSVNLDLLGLAPVLSSVIYYPEAVLVADEPLTTTGQLIVDVTLDIAMDDLMGGLIEDSVVISAAVTSNNTSLDDLVDDINTILDAGSFAPIEAELYVDPLKPWDKPNLMFTSLGYEFEIKDTSEHINLLGFRSDWDTTEYRELSELTASGAVPTTGQLVRDVVLVIRIDEVDLDDILLGAVEITAASTSTNTGIADLITDINDALAATAIPRYLSLDFADYITAEERSGELVLVGTHDFKVKSASQNVTLLGMTPGVDQLGSYVLFDAYLNADAAVPSAVLSGQVSLDIDITYTDGPVSISVDIPVDGTNSTMDDLEEDINAAFMLADADDLIFDIDGTALSITSLFDFTIKGASTNADLLGLTAVSLGGDVNSSRDPSQYEMVAELAIPTTGVLAEDVLLEVITTDSDDNSLTALVPIDRDDTDGTEGIANTSVDDLVTDVNNALNAAQMLLSGLQLQVVDDGGKVRFEAMGYFVIEITSVNAGLLGLSVVEGGDAVSSVVVLEPEEGYTATDAPASDILAGDVTLVITFGAGELAASVFIDADDTSDNVSLSDLLDDINAVLSSPAFDVQAINQAGTMVFVSDTVDIEITEDSENADLLGLLDVEAGTAEFSTRDPSLFELIAETDLSTTGILADNIALHVVMATYDPNDDPLDLDPFLDDPDPDTGKRDNVVYGTVIVYRDDALDNTGLTDEESLNNLIDDINDALIRGGFRAITASLNGSNEIIFSSPRAFEIDVEHAGYQAPAEAPAHILANPVTLDVILELPGGDFNSAAVVAVDGTNTSMEALQADVIAALAANGLGDLKVRLLGDYFEFYSRYGFTILGDTSINADLLGLTSVVPDTDVKGIKLEPASNAYVIGFSSIIGSAQPGVRPPETYRVVPVNSMVNGVLTDDISFDLSIDSGTYASVVTVTASATDGTDSGTTANASLTDLITDITNALEDTEVPGNPGLYFSSLITVQDERGVLVFVSDYDFTLVSEAADNLDQVGFGVDTYNSALSTPDYELAADDTLVPTGILTIDVTLVFTIDDGDGGTWDTTVVIENLETSTNTGIEDLLIDIENAFVEAQVLDGGIFTGSYASQFITIQAIGGKLRLAGLQEFTLDGDTSINQGKIGYTSVSPGNDGVATQPAPVHELFPYNTVEGERITLPTSRGLVDDVKLDLRVYDSYPDPISEYTVTIPAAGTTNNLTIADLIDDINAVLPADVWALEVDGFVVFESDYHFQIEYKSENENLLGLTILPHGDDIDANRSSNDGELPDDVTFVLWVSLGPQKIVGEVTITKADTAGNKSEGAIMDLVLDLQTALNNASYVNLDGDPYGNDPLTEDFSNDPVTVGGITDPIVKVKLKNGKILFASQYYFQIFDSFTDPEVGTLQSVHAELLGLDTVADGTDVESTRPFNIIAAAAGSEVVFGSETNPVGDLYIAGSVLSDHQITMVEGPDTNLDLDWSALLQTIDGPIILDLGENGFLKGDLIAGGDQGDVILTAHDVITVNNEILADRHVYIEAGFDPAISASALSVDISPTAWIRTAGPVEAASYEVIASVNLPATGILGATVTLDFEIDDGLGGTWTPSVDIQQSETTTNTNISDLLDDIIAAFAGVEVTPGTYLNQIVTVQNRGGKLVLFVDAPFTIFGDTSVNGDQLGLVNLGPGSDLVADNEQLIWVDGYNEVLINGPIGSLQTDEPHSNGNVLVTSQNDDIVITEQSGWIETHGRIVLEAANIDLLGVLKNAGATAAEPVGEPIAENYEIVIDASDTLTLTGDVDALGSVLITTPNPLTVVGTVEAGGLETFEFITEDRGFVDGVDERVRIEAPSIDVDGGTGFDGANGTDDDVVPEINEGETYPLGAQIVASGLIQLITPGGIDVSAASELIVRHENSLIYLEAEYVDLLGSLYAGADPNRVLMGEEPGVTWVDDNTGIEILAVEMVTFGGDDTATHLDVALGNADTAGGTMVRGGSAQATGTVDITVTGGVLPLFYLNELSFIKTDAVVIDDPTPGALGHITVTTDNGIEIAGVIQAIDPDSDVTLNSGTGLLLVSGYVEAGDELVLTGADTLSVSDVSVRITKIFYESRYLDFLNTDDVIQSFIIDEHGQPIDEYGFLLERDANGKVVVDIDSDPVRLIGAGGFALLGEGTVYITDTNDDPEIFDPVLVDKEGYQLVEYAEIVATGPVASDGKLLSTVTLDISLNDDDTGTAISGSPVDITVGNTATNNDIDDLRDDINTALDASPFADIDVIVREDQLVLTVIGYDMVLNDTSVNADQLGLVDWQTDRRFMRVDEGGQFLNDGGAVVNSQGVMLAQGGVLINQFGYIIDEYGNFVNEFVEPINAYGERVDQFGNLIADDQTTLIDSKGRAINVDGLLVNGIDELLNGVGAVRTKYHNTDDGIDYLADEYGNLVGNHGFLINQNGDIINQRGELTDENGVPLTSIESPVFCGNPIVADNTVITYLTGLGLVSGTVEIDGVEYLSHTGGQLISDLEFLINEDGFIINEFGELTDEFGAVLGEFDPPIPGGNRVLADPAGLEAAVDGFATWKVGSIQEGPTPLPLIGEMVMVDLPVRISGGTLNTTGPNGTISITGDKDIEIYGMVGLVYMDESGLEPVSAVDVTEVSITTPEEVYILSDALVNAKDEITIEGLNVWAMDESVTIARDPYSLVHLEATGSGPDNGKVYIARSQIYYFRALVAAHGSVELVGIDVGVFGTIQIGGETLTDAPGSPPSLVLITAEQDVQVRGEILSAGDVQITAGIEGLTVGNIAVSAEGKVAAGYNSGVDGDIELTATGEVILLAYNDTMNDDLEFAPAYVTYEPVYVDVVTGYRRVEAGFILRPVVHWIP
ncbi:MAG: hypothetical protein GY869_08125, partial [Planctomycetes bacterium]|nr:hypothetical protein [Planctomycetota bacterium]